MWYGISELRTVRLPYLLIVFVVGSFLCGVLPARATIIGPGILISAEDELGHSSSYQAEGTWVGEEYVWSLNEPFDFFDNNIYLGTLMDGSYSWYIEDPVAGISFTATSGNADTTFMLSSAVVSFPAITNPIGSLNASITITDNSNNGVQFSGNLGSGSAASLALYNILPPGTSFGELFSSTLSAGPGGSISTSGAVGPTAILGSIDSIHP